MASISPSLYVPALTPRFHSGEAEVQFAEDNMVIFLCRVNTIIVRGQSTSFRCCEIIIYIVIYIVKYSDKGGTFRHPCRHYSSSTKFAAYQHITFYVSEKGSNFAAYQHITFYVSEKGSNLLIEACRKL
jgi:hypothetical protein